MKRILRNLGIILFLAIGALILFALDRYYVVREHIENNRQVVRAKLIECSTVYSHAGTTGLQQFINAESDAERASTFVEVLGTDKKVRFAQYPPGGNETHLLSPLTDPNTVARTPEWLALPSSSQHKTWTIGRRTLPDGAVMFVGRTNPENHAIRLHL